MYEAYFGMTEAPFSLVPDTAFFYGGASYQAALNTLLLACQGGEGFIKITGEVGTGKTMLCRKFMSSLEPRYITAFLPNPCIAPEAMFSEVARELGVALPLRTRPHEALQVLNQRLLELARLQRRIVVCLDEAQAMSDQSLETLRLIGNLETEKQKLIQVVMFGQPELESRLQETKLRQLAQRITFSHQLLPMTAGELDYYLGCRLAATGYRGAPLFSRAAARALYRYSRGVPRLVNILTHKALMLVYARGARSVNVDDINRAALDTPAALVGKQRWWVRSKIALAPWMGA